MMTREEAIKRIDEQYKICEEFYYLSASPENKTVQVQQRDGGLGISWLIAEM